MDRLQQLRRRTFMKAVGLGISVPLAASIAKRVGAAPPGRPRRLMVVYFPDGVPPEHYTPRGSRDDFDLQVGEAVLAPLAGYQNKLNVLNGLQIGGGDENHESIAQLLLPGKEQGRSFEQVIAKALDTQALLLGVVPMKSAGEQFNSGAKNVIFRDGDWIRTEASPVRAAERLFGGAGAAPFAAGSDAAFRAKVLALGEGEVERLQREVKHLTSEHDKLAIHLDAIRTLKASSARPRATMSCSDAPPMPAVSALAAESDPSFWYSEVNIPKIYPAQLQVAANALVCGSARVVGLQVSYGVSEAVWSFLPGFQSSDQFHGTLSHADGSKPEIRSRFAKAKRWLVQGLADHVLAALDQPDPEDPGRSVLDNTLIVVTSELADGAMHNTNTKPMYIDNGRTMIDTQLPWITIGGGSGTIATGRMYALGNRPHADFLMTVCELMGARGSDFGAFTRIGELAT